jgi:hypothetical protein
MADVLRERPSLATPTARTTGPSICASTLKGLAAMSMTSFAITSIGDRVGDNRRFRSARWRTGFTPGLLLANHPSRSCVRGRFVDQWDLRDLRSSGQVKCDANR